MGNYDRSALWKMMQQRHPSNLSNAYLTGYNAMAASASNISTNDRCVGLQSLCGNDSSYYLDDRPGTLKRSRLMGNPSTTATRPTEYSTMKMASGETSNNGDPPRTITLNSYLQSPDTAPQYSYQQVAASAEGYGASNHNNATTASTSGGGGSDYNSDWFTSTQRANNNSSSSAAGAAATTNNSFPSIDTSTNHSSSLSRQSSLASPTTMFGMENLMNDYESGFYSLWNGSNNASVMGYDDADSPPTPSGARSAHSDTSAQIYIPEADELPDLNQGDLDYIYGSMDSSSTTPSSRTNGEPHVERLYSTSDVRAKRGRPSEESKAAALMPSSQMGGPLMSPLTPSGFRSLARNATIETKRPATASSSGTTNYIGSGSTSGERAGAVSRRTTTSPSTSSSATKRPRNRECDYPGCNNRARSHQKCKKHGGAHQCVFEGCEKNSQSRGLCIAHGGGSRCKIEGCTRASQSKGLCKSHGGGEFCAVEGCRKKAHLKHLCRTHGGGVRCRTTNCMKWAQRKGWCMAHAKEALGP